MKNAVAFIAALAAILAGAAYLVFGLQDRAEAAEFTAGLEKLRFESLRQVPILIQSPEDKIGYDRQQFVRKHLDGLAQLRKDHPGFGAEDAFINEMEAKAKAGEKDKAKVAEYRERYDYVKKIYDEYVKNGTYKPVLGGYNNGVRMEILSMKPSNDGGQQGIRMDVLLWGHMKEQFTFGGIEIQAAIELDEKEKSGKRKGQPKLGLMKVNGAGPPYVLVEKPWEWMPEWPPGLSVGYYVGLPLFHPKASKYTMTMDFTLRTQGGTTVPVALTWKDVAVDGAIRGAPGSQWDAEVGEASDDELKAAGIPVEE